MYLQWVLYYSINRCASFDEKQALLSRIKHNRGIGFKKEVEGLKEHEEQINLKNDKLNPPLNGIHENLINIDKHKRKNTEMLLPSPSNIHIPPIITYNLANHSFYNPSIFIINTQRKEGGNISLYGEEINSFGHYYNEGPVVYRMVWKKVEEQVLEQKRWNTGNIMN